MGIYETDDFVKLVPVNHTFIVPDMIFAKIEFKDGEEFITKNSYGEPMFSTLENCWATPT